MANYELFNGVGALVVDNTTKPAQIEYVATPQSAPSGASWKVDLDATPVHKANPVELDDVGVRKDGTLIKTTSNHYAVPDAFPVTTIVRGGLADRGAIYLAQTAFAKVQPQFDPTNTWPDGYGYKSEGVYQFQSMVLDDNGRMRRYHGFHAKVAAVAADGVTCELDVESFHATSSATLTVKTERISVKLDDPDQCTTELCQLQPVLGSEGCIFLSVTFCARTKTQTGMILRGPKLPPQG